MVQYRIRPELAGVVEVNESARWPEIRLPAAEAGEERFLVLARGVLDALFELIPAGEQAELSSWKQRPIMVQINLDTDEVVRQTRAYVDQLLKEATDASQG